MSVTIYIILINAFHRKMSALMSMTFFIVLYVLETVVVFIWNGHTPFGNRIAASQKPA